MRVITSVFTDAVVKTTGILSFNKGTKDYANIKATAVPRLWLHKCNIVNNIKATNKIDQNGIYAVAFDLSTTASFTASLDEIESKFDLLEPLYVNFINHLINDPRVIDVPRLFERIELIHELDQNLVGWMVIGQIKVKQPVTLVCPE
jgi:hypothetical protein